MSFLLDTNILSELRKGGRCDPSVLNWAAKESNQAHYISVLSLGEIRKGIELLRKKIARKMHAIGRLAPEIAFRLRKLHHRDHCRNLNALGQIISTTPNTGY